MTKICKDCGAGKRPVPYPGPRCATHHREEKRRLKEKAWADRIFKTYGLTAEQYYELYHRQQDRCFICQRATGASKRLAVDHDHVSGYVRGLLCSNCNKVLGQYRDDPAALRRAAQYLDEPPAFDVIGKVKPREDD